MHAYMNTLVFSFLLVKLKYIYFTTSFQFESPSEVKFKTFYELKIDNTVKDKAHQQYSNMLVIIVIREMLFPS